MGSIYGITVTSAIVQNLLAAGLPGALGPDATDEVCTTRSVIARRRSSANSVVAAHREAEEIGLCSA